MEGGAIYNAGTATIVDSAVTGNSAAFSLTNAAGQGDSRGDNDTGNGLMGNVIVEGGGIYNAGSLSITASLVGDNSASSSVTNGSGNGDNNGQGAGGGNNGDFNGNGVIGNVTVAGGGIYNFNTLTANGIIVSADYAASSVVNGSNNGMSNGVSADSSSGDDNGNGVDGNIIVSGGGIADDANGTATIAYSDVSGNCVASRIANGNNNGDSDGQNNAVSTVDEGRNNGNGVVGFVNVSGGGLDNDSGGALTLSYSVVSFNSAKSRVINGSKNGNSDGNDDGDGDGLASDNPGGDLTVHGGGIRNAGTLTVTHTSLFGNAAASAIRNGNSDGNNDGNDNGRSEEGRADGNCVSGDVLVAGGGIANSGTLTVANSVLWLNSLRSTITNGTNNGDDDGQNDGGYVDCGDNCGNGVGGNVKVDGGGIGNSGTATVTSSFIAGNSAASTVINGAGNGVSDGSGSSSGDGQGDGNGVNGNVEVVGGGTANVPPDPTTVVVGNSISSNPASGSGDPTLDGVVVNDTVSVSGQDTF